MEINQDRIAMLNGLMKEDPADPFLPYALALEYIKAGSVNEALFIFKDMQQNFPYYLPLYYQYALLLISRQDLEEAKTIISKGILLAEQQNDNHTKAELCQLQDEE